MNIQRNCTLFQAGWIAAYKKKSFDVSGLGLWDLYDFYSGFSAAIYHSKLPEHWIK